MDFKQFLQMVNEAESTAEKDDKAEKAGKKVAKDIEYDEGHKGKDDEKAEKAGKKVTKDIEYDDKKDKKSLKDWFEMIDKNLLAEAEQITMEPAKQNTQVIKQGTKVLGTVSNPQLAAQIKQSIGKGEMSLAGHDMKEEAEDNPESAMLETDDAAVAQRALGMLKAKEKAERAQKKKEQGVAEGSVFDIDTTGYTKNDMSAINHERNQIKKIHGKLLKTPGFVRKVSDEKSQLRLAEKIFNLMKRGQTFDSALVLAHKQGVAEGSSKPYDSIDINKWHLVKDNRLVAINFDSEYNAKSWLRGHHFNNPDISLKHGTELVRNPYLKYNPNVIDYNDVSAEIDRKVGKESVAEGSKKAKNPYAIGMAQAMKSTGDEPPLKKSTITKAHDIAKSIKKKTDEAEIPSSGPDYGAGLGAGRNDKVLEYTIPKNKYYVVQVSIDSDEGRSISVFDLMYNDKKIQRYRNVDSAQRQLRRLRAAGKPVEMNEGSITEASKPDFLDLDKDGNKKESMKKAAADKKKKKVDEAMNTLEAAYHEGKSHGLTKHGYACRYDEGTDEHRRYHEGFKEGLDECYGLMPNRGLVVSEIESGADVVDNMASYGAEEGELAEMDKTEYMQHKAKTTPGDTFKAFGQTFKDKDVLEADAFAFESLDKQLNDLLNEGLSVNMSQGLNDGMGGHGSDSVSVTATDDDAAKLLDFIKQVGLGGLGAAADAHGEPTVVASVSDYGAPKFQGHDDMMGLIKVASGEDYKDEEGHDHAHEEKMCETHGMEEAKCGCGEGKEMVDEVESEDQMEYQVAEDDGEGNIEADEQGAQIDAALAVGSENEKQVHEAGDGGEESSPEAAGAVAAADAAEEEEEAMSESSFLNLYKKLSLLSEESTAEKDDKAEKAGKKVAKDIEYDEGHKGKDDEKAEKAGKKVTKDIEYDDKKDKKEVNEWANDAGKDGTQQTFERDIEFMTKVISGGLNKPKSTGQQTIPVLAGDDERTGDEDMAEYKKLAGLGQ